MRTQHGLTVSLFVAAIAAFAQGNVPSGQAIAEVASGKRATANAAWWGFSKTDSTAALQAAIDSGAKTVLVPFMGDAWIVRPIKLRGNLELVFEPGVLVLAKRGEFQGGGDSLFTAVDVENLTIRGYGATLRMWKSDYQKPPYKKAEWRMGIAIRGCRNVLIEGVRVESSGGDGFYVDGGGTRKYSENVTIRNAVAHDNHRQGISVISAQNLLVENCTFSGTDGTPPEAGIDLEVDTPDQRFVNCVIRNCVFENNSGHAMLIYLKPLDHTSAPVSIRFENCHARMGTAGMKPEDFKDITQRGWAGMAVGTAKDEGPQGLIEFINCTSENTGKEGVRIFDKSSTGVKVRFVDCSWSNPWVSAHRNATEPRVPILIQQRRREVTARPGGIEFVNCYVYDDVPRAAVFYDDDSGALPLSEIHGTITVRNPRGTRARLGPQTTNVDLKLVEAPK
jgi:polygalacturonase